MGFPNPRLLPGGVFPGQSIGDFVYFNDFTASVLQDGGQFSTTVDLADWFASQTTGGVLQTKDDEPGGVLQIDGAGSNDQGYHSIQLNGESFKVAAGKDIYFETRIKTIEPLACDIFLGLATTDTTILAGTTEAIGFGTYDTSADLLDGGTGDIYTIVKNSASNTDYTDSTTLADSGVNLSTSFVTLAFHVISNERVKFYIGGAEKASVTTNIPSGDAVTLSMAMVENSGSDPELLVDYIYCAQVR